MFIAGTSTDAATTNVQTTVTFELTFAGPVTDQELEDMKTAMANVLDGVDASDISISFKTTLIRRSNTVATTTTIATTTTTVATTTTTTTTVVVVNVKTTPENANNLINTVNSQKFVTDFNKEESAPMQPLVSVSTPVCENCSKQLP